jgi:hypothetical protein
LENRKSLLKKNLAALVILIGLMVSWTAASHGFDDTRREPSSAASPTPFEAELQKGYPNIVQALLLTGARNAKTAHLDPSHVDVNQVVKLTAIQGFRRLDDPAMLSLAHLRIELARRADMQACAEMWNQENTNEMVRAIESSPADQQRSWAELFDAAAIATIKNEPTWPAPARGRFLAAIDRLISTIPVSQQTTIRALASGVSRSANTDQKCDTVRVFYRGLERIGAADAITITRYMLY